MKIIKPNELSLLSCSVVETDELDGKEWNASTTYAADSIVRYNHYTYTSIEDGNVGNNPEKTSTGSDAKWIKVVATMPYRMLDDYIETQTEAPIGEPLTFSVPFKRGDAMALLNIHGIKGHLKITDRDDGIVTLDKEIGLQDDIENLSLYEYYFMPITSVDLYINTDIPISIYGILEVTIWPGSEQDVAKVGHVICGRKQYIGETKYDAEVGITDYSRKDTDEFGITTFVERSYSKNATINVFVPAYRADKVSNILSAVRSKPTLIECSNSDVGYTSLTIYGWIEEWRQVYSGPNENELRIEVQGLIQRGFMSYTTIKSLTPIDPFPSRTLPQQRFDDAVRTNMQQLQTMVDEINDDFIANVNAASSEIDEKYGTTINKAAEASQSASNAATSEANAARSASSAQSSASAAATSERTATACASAAATSEINAATAARNAATSESIAVTKAQEAAASALVAATSEANSQSSADRSEAAAAHMDDLEAACANYAATCERIELQVGNDLTIVQGHREHLDQLASDIDAAIMNVAVEALTEELRADAKDYAERSESACARSEELAAQVAEDVSTKLAVITMTEQFTILADRVFRLERNMPRREDEDEETNDFENETSVEYFADNFSNAYKNYVPLDVEGTTMDDRDNEESSEFFADQFSYTTVYGDTDNNTKTDDMDAETSTDYFADIFSNAYLNG